MRKVKSNHITDSARLPFLKRTLDHLQDGNAEAMASIVNALINKDNSTSFLVLWGCVPSYSTVSVSNDTLTITAGAILYNGEIFQVAGATVTVTGSNVHILTITETGQTGEPTEYTDNTTYTTNVFRTLVLGAGASGSGDTDWSNVGFMNNIIRVTSSSSNNIFSSLTVTNGTLNSIDMISIKKGNLITINFQLVVTSTNTSGVYMQFIMQNKYSNPSASVTSIIYPVNCNNITDGSVQFNPVCTFNANTDFRVYLNSNLNAKQYQFNGSITYNTSTIG